MDMNNVMHKSRHEMKGEWFPTLVKTKQGTQDCGRSMMNLSREMVWSQETHDQATRYETTLNIPISEGGKLTKAIINFLRYKISATKDLGSIVHLATWHYPLKVLALDTIHHKYQPLTLFIEIIGTWHYPI